MIATRQWEFHALRRHYVVFRLAVECAGAANHALNRRANWMEAALYARWERRGQAGAGEPKAG